jgi:acetolactate synthase small subunit
MTITVDGNLGVADRIMAVAPEVEGVSQVEQVTCETHVICEIALIKLNATLQQTAVCLS